MARCIWSKICLIWSYDDIIIWSYDHMIIWSYDHMIIWSYDHMITWSHDHMVTWSYDHMIIWSYDYMIIWSYDRMMIWAYGHTIIWWYHMIIRSYDQMTIWSYDRAKIQNKCGFQSQKMKCWGSSETRFGQVSGQSEPSSEGKQTFKVCKNFEQTFVEKWNVGDRPKRVLAKFEADRSQVWRQSL